MAHLAHHVFTASASFLASLKSSDAERAGSFLASELGQLFSAVVFSLNSIESDKASVANLAQLYSSSIELISLLNASVINPGLRSSFLTMRSLIYNKASSLDRCSLLNDCPAQIVGRGEAGLVDRSQSQVAHNRMLWSRVFDEFATHRSSPLPLDAGVVALTPAVPAAGAT